MDHSPHRGPPRRGNSNGHLLLTEPFARSQSQTPSGLGGSVRPFSQASQPGVRLPGASLRGLPQGDFEALGPGGNKAPERAAWRAPVAITHREAFRLGGELHGSQPRTSRSPQVERE